MKKEEEYKSIDKQEEIEKLKQEILPPLSEVEKLKDPFVLASIMYSLANERENTNRLLKTILEKIDQKFIEIEKRIERIEKSSKEEILLSPIDEQIVEFLKKKGYASAEEVRQKFNYKGKNAASARLNDLCEKGILHKKQVGRVVVFFPN
jgi:predicted HTH transcriptional regulator